jgi:hypothetical protein
MPFYVANASVPAERVPRIGWIGRENPSKARPLLTPPFGWRGDSGPMRQPPLVRSSGVLFPVGRAAG